MTQIITLSALLLCIPHIFQSFATEFKIETKTLGPETINTTPADDDLEYPFSDNDDFTFPITPYALHPVDFAWDAVNLGLATGAALLSCRPEVLITDVGKVQCGIAVASTAFTSASLAVTVWDGLNDNNQMSIKDFLKDVGFTIDFGKEGDVEIESISAKSVWKGIYQRSPAYHILKKMNIGMSLESQETYYSYLNSTLTDFHFSIYGHEGSFFGSDYEMQFILNKNIVRMAAESKYSRLPTTMVKKIYRSLKEADWKEMHFKEYVLSLSSFLGDKTEEFVTNTKTIFTKIETGQETCKTHGFEIKNKDQIRALKMTLEKC